MANLKLHRLLCFFGAAADKFLAIPLKKGDDCVFWWGGKQIEGMVRNIHESLRVDVEYTQAGVHCKAGHKLVLEDLNPERFSRPEPRFCSSPEWVAAAVKATGFAEDEVPVMFFGTPLRDIYYLLLLSNRSINLHASTLVIVSHQKTSRSPGRP
jgi:hypothetical protein